MIVLGLTGKIGAGKSTVASLFADRGATVVDADRIAHEVLREPEVARLVSGRFGAGVLATDGSVDRRALAKLVFGPTSAHAAGLAALEAIVHPRVAARIEAQLDALSAGANEVVVLDVPLLSKSGLLGRCTRVVEVVCEESVRRSRLAGRGWNASEIEARDAAWDHGEPVRASRLEGEKRLAAEILDTSGDVRYTSEQVDRVLKDLAGSR